MNFFETESKEETVSNLVEVFIINYTKNEFLHRFLNVLLYQGDFGSISSENTTEIIEYFKQFVNDIINDIKNYDLKIIKKNILANYSFINMILEVKEDISISVNITYDNVLTHYTFLKTETSVLLNEIIENKITNLSDFRKEFNILYSELQIYNQFKFLRPTLKNLDSFIDESNHYNGSIVNWLKNFNNIILKANTELSQLSILKKDSNLENNFIFSDEESLKEPVDKIVEFLESDYRIYTTGYGVFDDSGSIDSSSLTVIGGPTNHAKSIFMINVMKKIIEKNSNRFDENDAILYISLEDDEYKIFKRLASIFGNYNASIIKSLFSQASELLKNNDEISGISNTATRDRIRELIFDVSKTSILDVTKNKIKFIVKYCGETDFSAADLCRTLDSLTFQGLNPRIILIDYVDLMIPSGQTSNKFNSEYESQGKIIHELRRTTRRYSVPILSITQNVRSSEKAEMELDNTHLADSFKKARYTDNIIMIRQQAEKDIFNPEVSKDLLIDENFDISNIAQEYLYCAIPFEVKCTKVKDGVKNNKSFYIFCTKNLRIYTNVNEFLSDMELCKVKSNSLQSKLNIIGLNTDININDTEESIDNLFV